MIYDLTRLSHADLAAFRSTRDDFQETFYAKYDFDDDIIALNEFFFEIHN